MTAAHNDLKIVSTGPLGTNIATYNREKSPKSQHDQNEHQIDATFIDAMLVREEVFVQEQGVPLENELDNDDAQCIHLVLYSKRNDASTVQQQPIGTIRILPINNILHTTFDKHRHHTGTEYLGEVRSAVYEPGQPYITLGRLAVLKAQRGRGYAEALVRAAISYAAENTTKLNSTSSDFSTAWHGLTMIHAQKQVQKFWIRCGFRLDEGLGIWDEEGIDHVAMWTNIDLQKK